MKASIRDAFIPFEVDTNWMYETVHLTEEGLGIMDPNKNVEEQLLIAKRIIDFEMSEDAPGDTLYEDVLRLSELVNSLDEWFMHDGALPERWKKPLRHLMLKHDSVEMKLKWFEGEFGRYETLRVQREALKEPAFGNRAHTALKSEP